jgi:hypothetical protein
MMIARRVKADRSIVVDHPQRVLAMDRAHSPSIDATTSTNGTIHHSCHLLHHHHHPTLSSDEGRGKAGLVTVAHVNLA